MTTLEFLKRVLPTEGIYCVAVIEGDRTSHGFYSTVEELDKNITALERRNKNTYYAVSAFKSKDGRRKQDNVRCTKLFAMDLDCGEGKDYPNQKAALLALMKFVKDMQLPEPMIVSSGNGLHVYWVLTRELEPDEWKPLAEALKTAAQTRDFHQDWNIPADHARILRPVGTTNPKGNKSVKLLIDRPPVDPDQLAARVQAYLKPVAPRKTVQSSLLSAMAVEHDYPPAVAHVVKSKCQQIEWGVDNPDQVEEPFWYSMLGVAAHCQDPETVAKDWSRGHPDYSERATLRKLQHWKDSTTGPATCAKFESERPSGCKGCPLKGKISSPASLGVQYQEVDTTADAPQEAAKEIEIPRPFKRTSAGIKITIDDTDIDVCGFDLYPVSYGRDESLGYEVCRYKWNRPHVGWQDLVLRQAYLADGTYREFVAVVADQGIVLETKRKTEYFQMMLRSYMNELRKVRTMTNLYATMGWKEDYKLFVLGDMLYRRKSDGTVEKESIKLAASSQRISTDMFGVRGKLDTWTEMTRLLPKAKLHAHMFALGVSFASPLLAFTGLKGMTVSYYGPTGGGKSLAQYMAQSVWGDPDKLHFQAKYTQNTLFSRFGMYSNLPVTIDEVTMMADKEVGDFLYWVSQGRDKARLNRNAEERDAKTWATFCIVSTNKPLSGKLIASGLDTDAQMARLLELTVPSNSLFSDSSDAGRKLYTLMTTNYGLVGDLFIQRLMEMGEAGINAVIAEATHKFRTKYNVQFSGEERYWEQVIVLADLALELAHGWGMIKFKPEVATKWVLDQIGALRKTVSDNQIDAFDLVAEYVNDNADATVRVMHTMGDAKPMVDYERMPKGSLRVRLDVYRKTSGDPFDSGTIMLDRTHFRKWLASRGGDYKNLTDTLAIEHCDATPKSKKFSLGKHTPIQLPQAYVIGINLGHPRMQGLLDQVEEDYNDLTLGQMKAVE